jgi:hypothetical protein
MIASTGVELKGDGEMFDMAAQLLLIENEVIESIKRTQEQGQEFLIGDIHSVRSPSVKRAAFNRLVRKGMITTVTRTIRGVNNNKGPGSGKSFFSHRKAKYFILP